MSYGLRLKKPAHLKNTNIKTIGNIPEVMLRLAAHHTPVLSKGDKVLLGQLIASAPENGTPIYSSVSGKILGTDTVDGIKYIRVENDNKFEKSDSPLFEKKKLSDMSSAEILERIRLCAIPEWESFSKEKNIRRLIINCLDEDNYSTDKKCIIRDRAREVVGGAKILLKLLGLTLCEIIIEKRSTVETNTMLEYIGESTLFDIIETNGKYPFADDARILSQLPSRGKDSDGEACIIAPHTAAAIYRAFSEGSPQVSRIVTIEGSAAAEGGCYELPLGTPVEYIAKSLTAQKEKDTHRFIFSENGAMKGEIKDPDRSFVTEHTHSLIFTDERDAAFLTSACIGCARCDKVCPDGLVPSSFIKTYENDPARALRLSGMDKCSECGACSYVCPAKLPIHEIASGNYCSGDRHDLYKKHKIAKAPVIRSADSTKTMNLDLIFVLCALLGWAVCRFGIMSLAICAAAVISAVGADVLFSFLTKDNLRSVCDLSSVVCGMLCALTMSIKTPLYAACIASIFAVIIVRGAFGGRGKNIIHSVFASRVIISLVWHDAFVYDSGRNYTLFDHLLGNTEGALGEVSFIILCACALYLIYRRVISAVPTLATLGAFVLTMFMCAPAGNAVDYVKITLISSAVMLVSIFCSSEYSSLPTTLLGRIAYGILCGSLAAVITRFTPYEGAYIAAVIASAVTVPIFNRLGRGRFVNSEDGTAQGHSNNESAADEDNYTDILTADIDPQETIASIPPAEASISENDADGDKNDILNDPTADMLEDSSSHAGDAIVSNAIETSVQASAEDASVTNEDPASQESIEVSNESFDIDSSKLLDDLTAEIGLTDKEESSDAAEDPVSSPDLSKIDSNELFQQLYNETE